MKSQKTGSFATSAGKNERSGEDGWHNWRSCIFATGAYLWHAILFVALIRAQLRKCPVMDRSTHFGVPLSVVAHSTNRLWLSSPPWWRDGRCAAPGALVIVSAVGKGRTLRCAWGFGYRLRRGEGREKRHVPSRSMPLLKYEIVIIVLFILLPRSLPRESSRGGM